MQGAETKQKSFRRDFTTGKRFMQEDQSFIARNEPSLQ